MAGDGRWKNRDKPATLC